MKYHIVHNYISRSPTNKLSQNPLRDISRLSKAKRFFHSLDESYHIENALYKCITITI